MDSLRFALLVIGIVIVLAIYWTARRKQAAEIRNTRVDSRIEPEFDAEFGADLDTPTALRQSHADDMPAFGAEPPDEASADIAAVDEPVASAPDASVAAPQPDQPDVPEKVIPLRIVAKGGAEFDAEQVILTLRGVGLTHGRFGIFHRLHNDDSDAALFSVASLTEPGSFDLQNLKDQKLAGLSFFMLRPGPGRGVDAYDKMVETARAVAISLQGELLDGDGSTLSIQRERFLREDLIQYELKHLQLQ